MRNELDEISQLDQLYNEARAAIYEAEYDDDDSCYKFDFAFALQKICSECHSGQWSELYALMSALSLEWQFNMGMETFDEDNPDQMACFEWLKDKLKVRDLYKDNN
jgi:hypothetical protein